MTRITQQQLESYLWGAAVLLRGTIDAGDYKQFIFPLLFFKRLSDVYDEETVSALRESDGDQDFALFAENYRFQIPADAHWREIRKVSRDVGRALQQAMRSIETANPNKLFGIFGDAQWTNQDRLSDAMLRDLIEHFSTLELTVANLPEDELGQGYEYLIKKFADDSGHTAAEFYTNRTVVHLMTEMLDVQPGETVYDPTCEYGGMFVQSGKFAESHSGRLGGISIHDQDSDVMPRRLAFTNSPLAASSPTSARNTPTPSATSCTPTSAPTTSSPTCPSTTTTGSARTTTCASTIAYRQSARQTSIGCCISSITPHAVEFRRTILICPHFVAWFEHVEPCFWCKQ